MDLTKIMDENLQSFYLKLNYFMSSSYRSSNEERFNKVTESQQIGGETVPKFANSYDIVTRFLVDLRELSHEELKNILVEVDAILKTVIPIPAYLDATLDYNVPKFKLKKILVDVFDLLNSLTKADANNAVASTSFDSRFVNSNVKEEKIQIYRKYKNRYNYMPPDLKSSKDSGGSVSKKDGVKGTGQNDANSIVKNNANSTVRNDVNSIVQNDVNSIVQSDVNSIVQSDVNSIVHNDLNDNTQNDINDTAQIDLNEKKYTLNDIIQNEHVYEMFKSRLKNSPYDDSLIKKNVSSSKVLTLKLSNGETVAKPMSYVAPLIMLKKCDDLYPIPLQNKEPMDKHFPSTSKQTNDSSITNSSKQMIKIERGANKTKDITNELPNDMDLIKIMDENLQFFHLKLNYCMSNSYRSSNEERFNKVTESQQIGGETVPKFANSYDIVTRFLVDLRELSHEELKNILVEVDAILKTVIPIPAYLDATLDYNVPKFKLKKILVDVFDLLNSLTKADANNAVASTSFDSRFVNSNVKEEKIQIYRKYKNRYNYMPPDLKSSKDSGGSVSKKDGVKGTGQNDANSIVKNNANSTVRNDVNSIVQNDVNSIVQSDVNSIVHNDLNDNTQNDINDTAQIDLNEKKYTLNDIIQNEHVYEMFKSRLKNSPYDDSLIKKNVSSSKVLTLKLSNGETVAKPMSYVAPLIMLKKCDDLYPIPRQNKEPMDKHFPSTSKQTNDSNITNSSKQMIKIEKGANKTKDITNEMDKHFPSTSKQTNDSNITNSSKQMIRIERGANKTKDITNDFKTITRKRRSTIKNIKYETSKKKKN